MSEHSVAAELLDEFLTPLSIATVTLRSPRGFPLHVTLLRFRSAIVQPSHQSVDCRSTPTKIIIGGKTWALWWRTETALSRFAVRGALNVAAL